MRPTSATVRLDAIVDNYRLAVQLAPASKSIAVIKANAYGHGLLKVAQALEPEVPAFAVAFIDEAVQLRDAGIRKPILVLQGATRATDITDAAANHFWLLLHQQRQVEWVLSSKSTAPVKVWLKVDTGMHRLGLAPEVLDQICGDLASSPNVQKGVVLCTHLACADDMTNPMTSQQVSSIQAVSTKHKLAMSIANSAGILCWPESHAEWNRPGYMLYGNSPMVPSGGDSFGLKPAMTMNSEIIAIRDVKPGEGVGYGPSVTVTAIRATHPMERRCW